MSARFLVICLTISLGSWAIGLNTNVLVDGLSFQQTLREFSVIVVLITERT
jgi:hypothetical protein